MRQETSYILSQIGNTDQTPLFFDMPSNATVQQEGSSTVLVRMLGLYYNAETFHFQFMNKIPTSGPNLNVTSKQRLPKIPRIILALPFYVKIAEKV
jgi:hypothetical protein